MAAGPLSRGTLEIWGPAPPQHRAVEREGGRLQACRGVPFYPSVLLLQALTHEAWTAGSGVFHRHAVRKASPARVTWSSVI